MTPPRCACGAPAMSYTTLCGIRERRCAACHRAAERQADQDIARAIAAGATWLAKEERIEQIELELV